MPQFQIQLIRARLTDLEPDVMKDIFVTLADVSAARARADRELNSAPEAVGFRIMDVVKNRRVALRARASSRYRVTVQFAFRVVAGQPFPHAGVDRAACRRPAPATLSHLRKSSLSLSAVRPRARPSAQVSFFQLGCAQQGVCTEPHGSCGMMAPNNSDRHRRRTLSADAGEMRETHGTYYPAS